MVAAMASLIRQVLGGETLGSPVGVDSLAPAARAAARQALLIGGPVLAIMAAIGAAGQIVQVGFLLSPKALQPRLERLNPVAGLKRIFSRRNLVKTAVNLAKLVVVMAVAWIVTSRRFGEVSGLPALGLIPGTLLLLRMLIELALWLAAVLLVIGVIDWLYQRWQHTRDLRMTKQQVKEERRSMEGDPHVKGRRYRMMRDIALQRINQQVPQADVVVSNPTHFAVALKYDEATMNAPRLVAKGADYMALRIRQVAAAAGVPIVERPPLARALYHGVEVGREISPEFYEAVAEILAYVYRLEREEAA